MKFEDAAQKESNLIALNQVIYLFQNNFIYENDNSDNACNIYKNYSNAGSAFSILRETETDYYDKIIKNFKMTGSDVVLKTIVSSINRGYSLSINTPDKESMVHSFINTFYGSTDGYCSGAFGIEGINYTLEEGILATASVREHIPISIIYPIPDFEHLLYPIYLLEDGKINMDKLSYNFKEKIIPDNDSIYVNNAFYEQSFDFLLPSDKKHEGEIINYSLFLYDSINTGLSAEDIHLEYLALAKKAGTDKLIEEWNNKLNTGN
jgi:hypothetical protein